MSAIRRFGLFDVENSIFIFTIDTTLINASGTDGSENPLTFRIPFRTGNNIYNNAAIIRVSDGRPDISVTPLTPMSNLLLTFATAGVYQITIIGRIDNFSFNGSISGVPYGYDRLKIISVDQWFSISNFFERAFDGCLNLVIKAKNTLKLPPNANDFFRRIKGFENSLSLFDTSDCISSQRIVYDINTPLKETLNPFWKSIITFMNVYSGNTFAPNVDRIEIISDTLEELSDPWGMITFQNTGQIRLICKTPNLKTIFRLHRNGDVRTRCHLGEIDVRNVINTTGWANSGMLQTLVDQTLLGWANNLPFMQAGVVWDWGGAKYSNNPAIIAAYNKITQQWGVIFTNLTMA